MKLSAALLARGFLVELVDEEIYLTDNAYLLRGKRNCRCRFPDDAGFLAETLVRLDLGVLVETSQPAMPFKLSESDQHLSTQQLTALFTYKHVWLKDQFPYGADDTYLFQKKIHGSKVPTACLDPHVALLVKALSAAGCFTYSSCDGYHIGGPYGKPSELFIAFAGKINTAWAQYIFNHAMEAGAQLPAIEVCYDLYLEYVLTERYSTDRKLVSARKQFIELGRHIYTNRLLLRGQRSQWTETYRSQKKAVAEVKALAPKQIQFRVRLSDAAAFTVEFTVQSYRELEANCKAALASWLSISLTCTRYREWPEQDQLDELEKYRMHVEEALTRQIASLEKPKTGGDYIQLHQKHRMLRERVEQLKHKRLRDLTPVLQIEISQGEEPTRWCAPWGDCKPVRIRVVRTDAAVHPREWRFVFRRTAMSGRNSSIDSWLLLWMGFREAFRS
jgi:hypothetical protein